MDKKNYIRYPVEVAELDQFVNEYDFTEVVALSIFEDPALFEHFGMEVTSIRVCNRGYLRVSIHNPSLRKNSPTFSGDRRMSYEENRHEEELALNEGPAEYLKEFMHQATGVPKRFIRPVFRVVKR